MHTKKGKEEEDGKRKGSKLPHATTLSGWKTNAEYAKQLSATTQHQLRLITRLILKADSLGLCVTRVIVHDLRPVRIRSTGEVKVVDVWPDVPMEDRLVRKMTDATIQTLFERGYTVDWHKGVYSYHVHWG
jgi:hypothetical protein